MIVNTLLHLYIIDNCASAATSDAEMQYSFMRSLLRNPQNADFVDVLKKCGLIKKNSLALNVCKWKGVKCGRDALTKGEIYEIHWEHVETYWLDGNWFPPTTEEINMWNMRFIHAPDTRKLPRKLDICRIRSCLLEGEVELRTLPHQTTVFDLSHNNLSGTVRLIDLPEKLRILNFVYCNFQLVVVYNDRLPNTLLDATFRENRKVKILCVDDEIVDKRIHN